MPNQKETKSTETAYVALLCFVGMLAQLLPIPSLAHDYWIEPETFRPKAGVRVPLTVYVGQHFSGESIPYFPHRYERYVASGPAGEQAVPGVLGDDPAGSITPKVAGLYTIGMQTRPDDVDFESAAEFEQYLHAEGLERNLALHRQRSRPGKVIRESYSRCAKSLIAVGAMPADAADKILDLPLELIAETNPYRMGKNPQLRLRLLYHSKPLEGALVTVKTKSNPHSPLAARTDHDGRVVISLPRPGVWLATAVHMVPASFFSIYDWNSLWASLTFEWP